MTSGDEGETKAEPFPFCFGSCDLTDEERDPFAGYKSPLEFPFEVFRLKRPISKKVTMMLNVT